MLQQIKFIWSKQLFHVPKQTFWSHFGCFYIIMACLIPLILLEFRTAVRFWGVKCLKIQFFKLHLGYSSAEEQRALLTAVFPRVPACSLWVENLHMQLRILQRQSDLWPLLIMYGDLKECLEDPGLVCKQWMLVKLGRVVSIIIVLRLIHAGTWRDTGGPLRCICSD